jgi:hypothetical protein
MSNTTVASKEIYIFVHYIYISTSSQTSKESHPINLDAILMHLVKIADCLCAISSKASHTRKQNCKCEFCWCPFCISPCLAHKKWKKKPMRLWSKKDIRLQDQISPWIHLPKHIQELPDRCRRLRLPRNNIACVHPFGQVTVAIAANHPLIIPQAHFTWTLVWTEMSVNQCMRASHSPVGILQMSDVWTHMCICWIKNQKYCQKYLISRYYISMQFKLYKVLLLRTEGQEKMHI